MSAINEPHPDESHDAADAFFGGPEEEATPDPGDFNPETGDFSQPTSETRTDEERSEDAYQYAKSHGEPITEGMEAKHQAYLAASGQTPQAEEGEPSSEEVPEPLQQQERLRAIHEKEQEAAAAPDAAVAPEVTEPEPEAQPQPAADSNGAKKSGDLSREYIVFHRVPLTKKVLEYLLKQIVEGEAPEPQVAWIEVDRAEARNVNGAVAAAYTRRQDQLGKKVDLAAVSSRSFQVKHVEPKERIETNLSIT